MRFETRTAQGKRQSHEDRFLARPSSPRRFAVCDGLGGHDEGDVAAQCVVDALQDDAIALLPAEELIASLVARLRMHTWQNPPGRHYAPATTLTMIRETSEPGEWEVIHVGDSRAYWLPAGASSMQVSVDHAIFGSLTQALNASPKALIPPGQIERISVYPGDRILLATDGLWDDGGLGVQKIYASARITDLAEAADALMVRSETGSDNRTIVLVEF